VAAKGGQAGTGGVLPSHIHERPGGGYEVADGGEAVPHHRLRPGPLMVGFVCYHQRGF